MSCYQKDNKKDYESVIVELMQKMIAQVDIKGDRLYRLLSNLMQYLNTGKDWYNDLFGTELHFFALERALLFVPELYERGFTKTECDHIAQQVAEWWESYQSVLLCTLSDAFSLMKKKRLFDNRAKICELRKSYSMQKDFNESQKKFLELVHNALVEATSTSGNWCMAFSAGYMGKSLAYLEGYKSDEYRINSMQKMLMEVLLKFPSITIGEIINLA